MLQAVMKLKVCLVSLFVLITSLTAVCPQKPTEIYVKAGEMVALLCHSIGHNPGDAKLIWTNHTTLERNLTSSMLPAEQGQLGLLVHGKSLVIFNASVDHQGKYSCSLGSGRRRSWFRLIVSTPQTREYEEKNTYSQECYSQQSCTLRCPDVNTPAVNIRNITDHGTTWHKDYFFPRVDETDRGVYTCTRSYLYNGQIYKMSFNQMLDVLPKSKFRKSAVITSPNMGDVFHVVLGSKVVIDCKAVLSSDSDELYWLNGDSFLDTNDSLPVYYKEEESSEEKKTIASLVFKHVSEEDLKHNYTCKLDTDRQPSIQVNISLAPKPSHPSPSYASLSLGITFPLLLMVLTALIYTKFKISITLFLRDTLGCHSKPSDEKIYDAFLMSYKGDRDTGLSDHDTKWLKNVLEERFGYTLCLYDRDVLPGEAVAEAVLDCIEQSRTVVLVPTSSDPSPGSGLLSAVHAAFVERQTRLVFIKTETTEDSLPEALQLLGEAGNCVTWKGTSSTLLSSSFWKQLRYRLHAPQNTPRSRLLLQTK